MEENLMTQTTPDELFNSALETGVRTVVILNAAYPRSFDIKELTWLDHLVVHTGDISGPQSLHPNVPHRDAELLVRRSLIEQGISLMRRLHMIEAKYTSEGIVYIALDQAGPFVKLIRTRYGRELKSRAEWLVTYLSEHGEQHLHEVINEKIGRWAVEFQADTQPGSGS